MRDFIGEDKIMAMWKESENEMHLDFKSNSSMTIRNHIFPCLNKESCNQTKLKC